MRHQVIGILWVSAAWATVDPTREGHPPSGGFTDFPVVENLPLFQPIEVEGREVSMWNRRYTLGPAGWIQAIESSGKKILKGPMVLEGKIGNVEIALAPTRQSVVEKSATRAVFVTESTQGPAVATVKTIVESDGMIRFVADIRADQALPFQDIRVRLPLDDGHFRYLHYVAETKTKCDTQALPEGEGIIWGSRDVQRLFIDSKLERKSDIDGFKQNANVVNSFVPLIWIGDADGGIAWFAESDEGWQDAPGRSIVELTRTGGILELRVNFISGMALRDSAHLDFGLQVTPVKPLPEGWRDWQQYNGGRIHARGTPDFSYYDSRIPDGSEKVIIFDLDFIGFDTGRRFGRQIADPQRTREILRGLKERRRKVLAYMTPSKISHVQGVSEEWGEWRLIPEKTIAWRAGKKGATTTHHFLCHNAPGNYLNLLEFAERLVNDYDIDGVYVDVPFFNTGCMAPGCSYRRADGARQPIFKISLMRDFYKKLAGIFVRHGKYPHVLVHNSTQFVIPAFAFCWAGKPGEFMAEINYEQNHMDYLRSHRAKAIVEFNPRPWGLVPFCMDDIKFTRYSTLNPRQSFSERDAFEAHWKRRYLGVPLLHDGLIMNWCATPEFSFPIYKARMDFGIGAPDVEFHGYWENDAPKASDPEVAVSYYTRPRSVMMVLGNFRDSDTECAVKLPPAILSRVDAGGLVDPISREAVPVRDEGIVVRIGPQQCRILVNAQETGTAAP